MFFKGTSRKYLTSFFVIALIFAIFATPLMAAFPVKTAPYKELEDSHLYIDEIAYYCSYLLNRAMVFYELAMYTGDFNYLSEIKPLFDSTNNYLKVVSGTSSCSSRVLGTINDISKYLSENANIIDSILASVKPDKVFDTTKINSLISEIDSLDDIVLSKINPIIGSSQIDIMSVGNMSAALRLKQQLLMRAVFTRISPSARRTQNMDALDKNADFYLDFFKTQAEKSISKATVATQKSQRQQILDSTLDFFNKADALVEKIATFDFPSAPALALNNIFMLNLDMADSLVNTEILGAVFT